MIIKSYLHDYTVDYVNGFDFFEPFRKSAGKLAVIDRKVYSLYKSTIDAYFGDKDIMLLDADEHTKTVPTSLAVCERAAEIAAKRNLKLIAIGGGIIQDIAGFAANILYRGAELILVPTTLLAQGDSCIGSKNSINYLDFKNLLGTFYPPKNVYVCSDFLPTLTDVDFNSGLAEILRFIIMADSGNLRYIKDNSDKMLSRDYAAVREALEKAHAYKKQMVERDEFDLKERRIFNYGHTFGHAFESVSDYAVPHGLAVALGMVTANRISFLRGRIAENIVKDIEGICLRLYNGVPFDCGDYGAVVNALKKDKKRESHGIAAVLSSADGGFEVVQDVTEEEVIAAVKYMQNLFGFEISPFSMSLHSDISDKLPPPPLK